MLLRLSHCMARDDVAGNMMIGEKHVVHVNEGYWPRLH